MVINSKFNATLLSCKENTNKENAKFYNISIEVNEEVGTLPCNEEVYNTIQNGKLAKYKQYVFTSSYNDRYSSMRIIKIES